MSQPLVTIITPTYNRADFLVETIESVLAQDYPNIEYIVLDDGSKDNTADIIKPFEGKLIYSYHSNMGETATVNKGFEMAKGDIVCVVNSDDPLFVKDAVTTAIKNMNDNPDALMAYPDWVSIDSGGHVIYRQKLPQYNLQNMLESANVALGPSIFIRKSTIEKVGLRNASVRYVGDLDYSFRVAASGKIIHIPHFLATHRVHLNSLSSLAKSKRMADEVAMLAETYVSHPSLSVLSQLKKNHILAKWYYAATHYCGQDAKTKIHYLKKSIQHSPWVTFCMALHSIYDFLVRIVRKIFPKKEKI